MSTVGAVVCTMFWGTQFITADTHKHANDPNNFKSGKFPKMFLHNGHM